MTKMSENREKNTELEYLKVPTTENGSIENTDIPVSYGHGVRHIQIFIAFLSLTTSLMARAHIGVTVVAMTNSLNTNSYKIPAHTHKNVTREIEENTTAWEDMDYENNTVDDFYILDIENSTEPTFQKNKRILPEINSTGDFGIYKKFDWSKATQELVLGSFFLGYSIMMIPMGVVSQKFGGKLPMQIALFLNGTVSLITPWMAAWGGWKAVCTCRILQGLSQAGMFPSLQLYIRNWSSSDELGRFYSWTFTGTTVGTVIAFQLSGFLSAKGWPWIFWVVGLLCFIMFLMLTLFGAASPSEHKSITELERRYITGKVKCEEKKNRKVPLKAILTSKHVWASWCTHIGSGIAYVFFFTQAPTYIHYILNVNVKESGLLSSLPYIVSSVTSVLYGFLSDFLTNRNILSLKNARRVSNTFSQFGVAICFLAVSYTKKVELAIFCFVMSMVFNSATHTGWMITYIDMSPNFSATIMSIGNTLSHVSTTISPLFVSLIVTDVTNQLQWRVIFLTMAGIVLISNIVFVIFMSPDVQPWNDYGHEESEIKEQTQDVKN